MQLEARPLEPLHLVLSALDRFGLQIADGLPKQRKILTFGLAASAIDFQPAGVPGFQDIATHIVAGLWEKAAAGLLAALGKRKPVAPLLNQAINTQTTEQHIVGTLVFRVQL